MNSSVSLEQLQRTMASAVMMPLTNEEMMQRYDDSGRSIAEVASGFVLPNRNLTAFERLEIYNRQYWFRLQSAFREDFPALLAVVGARRFESLMNAYLLAHPSRSFTLRNLGSKLLQWLRENPHWAGSRHALAIDVVRVEWACIEAFDNAELPPLSIEEVAILRPESRLSLQPHIQLLALDYPADELVLDLHKQQKDLSTEAGTMVDIPIVRTFKPLRLRKRLTWLAIHRAELSLYYKRLTKTEFLVLRALQSGQSVAASLEAGFLDSRLSNRRRIELVQGWFSNWAELGWICKSESK